MNFNEEDIRSDVGFAITFWSAELLNNYGYIGQGSVLSLPIFT